jgi:hypothetical protein
MPKTKGIQVLLKLLDNPEPVDIRLVSLANGGAWFEADSLEDDLLSDESMPDFLGAEDADRVVFLPSHRIE